MNRERTNLAAALATSRRHVLRQVEGLDDAALRRPLLPSGWSALGLIRHLTLSDERYWFEVVVAGHPMDWWPEGPNGDWRVSPDESGDDIIAAHSLDAAPRRREPGWDTDDFPDLRSILQHVIIETATHAGHLDAHRELLDGRQHLVL